MLLSEHVYCMAVAFKMTEQVEQWICIKFFIKVEHSSVETIWMGNWWLVASSWQCAHSCTTSYAEFFGETSNHPGDSVPPTAQVCHSASSGFSQKLKSPLKGKISDLQWGSGKYDGAADGNWENCVRSQGAYFGGYWGVIVLYTMLPVSYIFFNKCLYFSYYMAGYLLDRPCISQKHPELSTNHVICSVWITMLISLD